MNNFYNDIFEIKYPSKKVRDDNIHKLDREIQSKVLAELPRGKTLPDFKYDNKEDSDEGDDDEKDGGFKRVTKKKRIVIDKITKNKDSK